MKHALLLLATAFALRFTTVTAQSIVVVDESRSPAIGVAFRFDDGSLAATDEHGRLPLDVCRDSFRVATELYHAGAFPCRGKSADTIQVRAATLALATVSAARAQSVGGYSVTRQYLDRVPAILGEPDLLRGLQSLPGIGGQTEGTVTPAIRGGSADQTLVLLDEAVLYGPAHLLGYQSAVSAEIAGGINVHTSRYPVEYGDRVSGIVEVQTRDGRRDRHRKVVGIGMPNASILAEGPVGEGSYLVNGRVAYPSLFALATGVRSLVGDYFAKATLPTTGGHRFEMSAFQNRDLLTSVYSEGVGSTNRELTRLSWGNDVANAKYTHHGRESASVFGLTYSAYVSGVFAEEKAGGEVVSAVRSRERRNSIAAYARHHFQPMLQRRLRAYAQLRYEASSSPGLQRSGQRASSRADVRQFLTSASIHNEVDISRALTAEVGARLVHRRSRGEFTAVALEPRLALVAEVATVRYALSYDRMTQPVHVISTGGSDAYRTTVLPESSAYPATVSDQVAISADAELGRDRGHVRGSIYYRSLEGVVRYLDGFPSYFDLAASSPLATRQDGRAYGVEAFAVLTPRPASTTSIGYALTRSERRNLAGADTRWQRYRYDRRHSLSVLHTERLSARWTLDAQFTYQSGFAFRAPAYVVVTTPFYGEAPTAIFDERYERSVPASHRLDLGFRRRVERGGRTREWIFSLYNAYARQNPSAVYYEIAKSGFPDEDPTWQPNFVARGFLRAIPGVMYRIELR